MGVKLKSQITFRDLSFLLLGVIIGFIIIMLYLYYYEIAFLNNIRIESLTLGFNESTMIDLIMEKIQ